MLKPKSGDKAKFCQCPHNRTLYLHTLQSTGNTQTKSNHEFVNPGEEHVELIDLKSFVICLEQSHHFYKNIFVIYFIEEVHKLHTIFSTIFLSALESSFSVFLQVLQRQYI